MKNANQSCVGRQEVGNGVITSFHTDGGAANCYYTLGVWENNLTTDISSNDIVDNKSKLSHFFGIYPTEIKIYV